MQDERSELEWGPGDVPISTQFDDPYFSADGGLAETNHVFLAGNGLPDRFSDGFHVAELGFGSGLNLLAALRAWRHAGVGGVLTFTSFEAYPMRASEMIRAQKAFPELNDIAEELAPHWHADNTAFSLHDLRFTLIVGDARKTLPKWQGRADAWFLDGFSPAKNPELWEASLLKEVGTHTSPCGTVATYTAAGFVRRGLQAAGFDVDRIAGHGRKRHMTRGVMVPISD